MARHARPQAFLPVILRALFLAVLLVHVAPSHGFAESDASATLSASDPDTPPDLSTVPSDSDSPSADPSPPSSLTCDGDNGNGECGAHLEGSSSVGAAGAEGDAEKQFSAGTLGQDAAGSPFSPGPYFSRVVEFSIGESSDPSKGAPKTLQGFAPARDSAGAPSSVPLVVFFHGYALSPPISPLSYTHMLKLIASHGFFVLAPSMGLMALLPTAKDEIKVAANVVAWAKSHIFQFLPQTPVASPDIARLAVAGHSRGGKVAFGVALNILKPKGLDVNAKALIAIDPVDGMPWPFGQTAPPIVNLTSPTPYLSVGAPTLVIGTGLGPTGLVACAPKKWGHEQFYPACKDAAYHVTATDYGHMDMVEDSSWASSFCPGGPSRDIMRSFCGGLAVSFLKMVFERDGGFLGLLQKPSGMPLNVTEVEWHAT